MSNTPGNTIFRTLRPVRIASLTGHVICIEPGSPVAIPEELHAEAYAMGCVPVDSPEHIDRPVVPLGDTRERGIIDSIHVLITAGDAGKFRKDGVPTVKAVEEVFGFAVTSNEVEAAFDKVKSISDALNDKKEVPETEE